MKKILIFGLPRTGTTVLEEQLSRIFSVTGWCEPYADTVKRSRYVEWTSSITQGIIKILTTETINQLHPIDVRQLIGMKLFDGIVVAKRDNKVDVCLSLYYAEQVIQKYQFFTDETVTYKKFDCDEKFAVNFSQEIREFNRIVSWLQDNNISFDWFDYDAFLQGKTQTILAKIISSANTHSKFKKSNIDYRSLCNNYDIIEQIIKSSA